jgi:hypothetical protein
VEELKPHRLSRSSMMGGFICPDMDNRRGSRRVYAKWLVGTTELGIHFHAQHDQIQEPLVSASTGVFVGVAGKQSESLDPLPWHVRFDERGREL